MVAAGGASGFSKGCTAIAAKLVPGTDGAMAAGAGGAGTAGNEES